MRGVIVAACALLLGACSPPAYQARMGVLVPSPLMVYEGAAGPLSYQTPTHADARGLAVVGETRGESCQQGLAVPVGLAALFTPSPAPASLSSIGVAWGEGGYAEAMKDAEKNAEKTAKGGRLVDIRADLHVTNILLVWRRQCLEIHASVVR
jgi:hypothetical protein